jgi:hypothetical protein
LSNVSSGGTIVSGIVALIIIVSVVDGIAFVAGLVALARGR